MRGAKGKGAKPGLVTWGVLVERGNEALRQRFDHSSRRRVRRGLVLLGQLVQKLLQAGRGRKVAKVPKVHVDRSAHRPIAVHLDPEDGSALCSSLNNVQHIVAQ